ncbi:hypothetical protein Dimus_018141 [Dionaea muscipula]
MLSPDRCSLVLLLGVDGLQVLHWSILLISPFALIVGCGYFGGWSSVHMEAGVPHCICFSSCGFRLWF